MHKCMFLINGRSAAAWQHSNTELECIWHLHAAANEIYRVIVLLFIVFCFQPLRAPLLLVLFPKKLTYALHGSIAACTVCQTYIQYKNA